MPFRSDQDQAHTGSFRGENDRPADTGLMDYAKSLGAGVIEGAASTADQLHQLLMRVPGLQLADTAAHITSNAVTGRHDPTIHEVAGQSVYEPQTTAGRYLKTIGEFAPGLAMPGSALGRIAGTVAPALAYQGVGDAGKAMQANPKATEAAQLLATVLAGGLTGGVKRPGTADRMLAESTKAATDAQIQQAAQLMKTGQGLPNGGVRLTGDEALAKVTGGSGIQRLSRGVVSTRKGGSRMAEALRDRPDQVRNATMGALDQIAPPIQNSDALGLRGQAAAEGAVREVQGQRSAAVNPDYTAAGPKTVDPQGMQALLSDIDKAIAADKTGLIGGDLGDLRKVLSASPDVENIDRVRKFYRDRTDIPIGSTDALSKESAGAINGFLQRLSNEQGTGLLDAVPEFASGKQKYQDLSRTLVEPVTSGPVGRIATEATDLRADPVQQSSRLYPSNPPEGSVNGTVAALRSMNGQDPNIGADLTRLHLTNRFNETAQDLQTGKNPAGGANFAKDIAGNREQEANLFGGLNTVAPQAAPTIRDLVEVLRATGMRGNEGSPTAGYQAVAKDLGVGEAPVEGAKALAQPFRIPSRIGSWLENRALERNSDKLLDALLAKPDDFQAMLLRARRNPSDPMALDLARGLAGYSNAQGAQ